MKKLLTAMLSLIMLFTATGCANDNKDSSGNTPQPSREKQELVSANEFGFQTMNDKFYSVPFYSDNNDAVTYLCNALWEDFGIASGGKVYKLGLNSAWLGIDALKTMWNVTPLKSQAKKMLVNYPQRDDGYLWSWTTSETWGGPGYSDTIEGFKQSYHFDQQFEYINGVREVVVWEASADFLNEVDTTEELTENVPSVQPGSSKTYNYNDASKGKTVLQKVELAFNYILNELNGKNGLIIIDNGLNTGGFNSSSSNIWDTLCFGYKDPYEGALFLNCIGSMQDIYTVLGNTQKVAEMKQLFEKAKAAYDETYWDAQKGRYISTITDKGEKLDYGLTFLGFMAFFTGAGDTQKAKEYFKWIDGERIIDSDDATGLDILDRFNISAMSNTVAIEKTKKYDENDRPISWFHAPNGISEFYSATFGEMLENGGTIFYTSFYENMSRIKHGMQEDALQRLITIAKEYKIDELNRDPVNNVGFAWKIGVIEEFPENGLVPLVYVKGFMGVNAKGDGLHIEPVMPEEYSNMGSKQISYAGNVFDINIRKGQSITVTPAKTGKAATLVISDFLGKGAYSATVTNKDGTTSTVQLTKNADGKFVLNLDAGYIGVVIA